MQRSMVLAILMVNAIFFCYAQDEGTITKRSRLDKSAGVFISGGPSFTLGKNIGDYSTGVNFEAGYLKRVNRVLSLGPSFSYTTFKYDPDETGLNTIFAEGPYYDDYANEYYLGGVINLKGGDISLLSLGFTAKLNFIPVRDNSVFSFYGFLRPTISMASHSEVTGVVDVYYNYTAYGQGWEYYNSYTYAPGDGGVFPAGDKLKSGSEVTGGIVLGPRY